MKNDYLNSDKAILLICTHKVKLLFDPVMPAVKWKLELLDLRV